jgi:aspartyl-tRNA(Asn)/glutamyl-tRNA(Gln) amidotransferase subunit C
MADRKTVERVARLARLNLTEKEAGRFSKDLEGILKAFKEMEKAPVQGVPPSFQPLPRRNVLREDSVEQSLGQEDALRNAKARKNGYFKGPRAA